MVLQISNPQPPEPSAVSKLIDSSGFKTAAEATAIEILHNLRYQHDWTDLRLHIIHVHDRSRSGSGLGLRSIDDDDDNDDDDDTAPSFTMVNLEGDSYLSQHYQSQRNPTSTPTSTTTTSYEPRSSSSADTIQLISGLPPRHSYIHPDLQLHLLKHSIPETSLAVQREFVLPLSTAEKWTLRRFCAVFDALSEREKIVVNVDSVAAAAAVAGGSGHSATRANGSATPPTGPANRARTPTPPYEHKDQKRVVLGMRAREGRGGDGTIVYYIMQEGEVKPRQNG